jgi:hypothetical protein
MKTNWNRWALVLGAIAISLATAPNALAACGGASLPLAHHTGLQQQYGKARLLRTGLVLGGAQDYDDDDGVSIVGMWHVTFTAKTLNGSPIPDTEIDNALVVLHSDKTEIMNSGRPPQDGNFCLGVWERTGRFTYYLNHFPWLNNDTANAPGGVGNPTGPSHLVEWLTLSPDGKHYSGTFKLDGYDTSNNLTVSFTGVLAATRITTSTTEGELY